MAMIRIWQKKKLKLDHLTFRQRDMVQIGSAGLLSVFKRLSEAKGPNDGPAKPLTTRFLRKHRDGTATWINKGYAMQKARKGRGRFRNLRFTGDMLRNLSLRTVSDDRARAGMTSQKQRDKGQANQKIEPWLVFSPQNRQAVMAKAREIFAAKIKNLIISKP
jgi:hypothetical protein